MGFTLISGVEVKLCIVQFIPIFFRGAFDLPESESGFDIMILIRHFI